MTPERKEEIKREAQKESETIYGNCSANITNIELLELLAALEESQNKLTERELMLKESLDIATRLEERLAEAQQTIARLNMALTHIRTYEPYSLNNMLTFIESRCQEAFGEGVKES